MLLTRLFWPGMLILMAILASPGTANAANPSMGRSAFSSSPPTTYWTFEGSKSDWYAGLVQIEFQSDYPSQVPLDMTGIVDREGRHPGQIIRIGTDLYFAYGSNRVVTANTLLSSGQKFILLATFAGQPDTSPIDSGWLIRPLSWRVDVRTRVRDANGNLVMMLLPDTSIEIVRQSQSAMITRRIKQMQKAEASLNTFGGTYVYAPETTQTSGLLRRVAPRFRFDSVVVGQRFADLRWQELLEIGISRSYRGVIHDDESLRNQWIGTMTIEESTDGALRSHFQARRRGGLFPRFTRIEGELLENGDLRLTTRNVFGIRTAVFCRQAVSATGSAQ